MKIRIKKITEIIFGIILMISGTTFVHAENENDPTAVNSPGIAMYRLYNPNSGEHFYTSSWKEASTTIAAGWNSEGIGWYAPSEGDNVYRLYNAVGGEHHYTMSVNERDTLVSKGWKDEGVGWKSGGNYALHREYNPNAFANNHNYTISQEEHDKLVSLGWHDEGIAWYATGTSNDYMRGIDISQWNYNENNNFDLDLTPYVGQFVIIRAGYGWSADPSSVTADNFSQVDTKFKENVEKCEQLGIPYGFYWYSYAVNADEAKMEAETFYAVTANYNPAFGFWMDEEGDKWKNTQAPDYENHDNISNMVNVFVSTMRDHGRNTGVYANYNWFNNYITTDYPMWVAHYGQSNDGNIGIDLSKDERHFVMHQYTSNPIDKDLLYVTYSDLFN